ncbi:NAD(P)H-binding protein [Reyranella sp.]|uniref:SDR family oxidoreductase n=1 Tax=Reyranella sp. TaxID=1929291 RepID=UPI003D0E6103
MAYEDASARGNAYLGRNTRAAERIAVIGASGRSGSAVCRLLTVEGHHLIAVQRRAGSVPLPGLVAEPRIADLDDPKALAIALADATVVVNTAHARWTPQVIAAAPRNARLVLMGSTRRFSRWADPHGDGVRLGEAAFLASGRSGVMLHPTLIYSRQGNGDVQRLAALLSRLPVAPLPGGGRSLVQPIHQGDVARCLLAAALHHWDGPETMVIAGPEPIAYRDFLRAVAEAAGLDVPRVLEVPAGLLQMMAPLSAVLPGVPRIDSAQIRRLTEDKAFDIAPMRQRLGVVPIPLGEGLAETLSPSFPSGEATTCTPPGTRQ